jgi:hypothetical protein
VLEVGSIHNVDPRRQFAAERMIRVVDRRGHQRIVIAGQQEDRSRGSLLAELAGQRLPPLSARVGFVEEVPGAEHGVGGILLGNSEDSINDIQPRSAELRLVGFVEAREATPEVPVGCVH